MKFRIESWPWKQYEKLGSKSDLSRATAAKKKVPDHIVNEFVWRRERNFNVTMEILRDMKFENSLDYFYVSPFFIELDKKVMPRYNRTMIEVSIVVVFPESMFRA